MHEWALTILNQTIRADAEFQINQRSAWQEFSSNTGYFKGLDITAGFQHQRNLFLNELTFEFDLEPEMPNFWDKAFNILLFRKARSVSYYRLKRTGQKGPEGMHVKLIIKRDADNRYRSELTTDSKNSPKPEDIHVVDLAR